MRHFNAIMNNMKEVHKGARDALRTYLSCGDPDPDTTIADEDVQLFWNWH